MLSPEYFGFRWSWYRPILNRGEDPTSRCKVDVRRLPLRIPGEDAREYVPYAVSSAQLQVFSSSIKRLYDYSITYMIEGKKVSAHQLPQMNAVGRALAKHLRTRYPHLPPTLLHHWCGDENGALALFQALQNMWKQSWKQDQADTAPWVPAVNVLVLKLIREAIGRLPGEHAAHTDHVMVCVVGGLYEYALQNFLKQHVDGAVEVTRIATYEAMTIPATPISFLYRQPDDSLLGEDRFVVMAYGLEADIIPRMRALREKVGAKNEAGILPLLAKDRMGEHMLKRSWTRLALWSMAEKSGQGLWMHWVRDAKALDQLIARPETLPDAVKRQVTPLADKYPVAAWLHECIFGKGVQKAGTPWLRDDQVLMAFRVFEEDVKVEVARRKMEILWSDQREQLAGKARGAESDKALEAAYEEGKLVYFQQDTVKSLHGGGASLATKQGALRIDWSEYLAVLMSKGNFEKFLEKQFLPGVLKLLSDRREVFLDGYSASGCMLRGSIPELMKVGIELRKWLLEWFAELTEGNGEEMPPVSMCQAMMGDWSFARVESKERGNVNFAFGLAVAQADAGVSRDSGVGRLIAEREKKAGLKGLGNVRVEPIDGNSGIQLLYNHGYALTAPVVAEISAAFRNRAKVREFRVAKADAEAVLSDFRLLGDLHMICILPQGEDAQMMTFVRVGKPALAGVDIDMYELLDPHSHAARLIETKGLEQWG